MLTTSGLSSTLARGAEADHLVIVLSIGVDDLEDCFNLDIRIRSSVEARKVEFWGLCGG